MLRLDLLLSNPFVVDKFKNLCSKSGLISTNKAVEAQVYRHSPVLIKFELVMSHSGRDHAGYSIAAGICGYVIEFSIFDTRHWDYKNKCWETNNTPV